MTSDPNLDLSYLTICQLFGEEAIPGCLSMELSYPPLARHHPVALALCISFLSGICLLNPTNQQRIDAYCA